MNCILSLSLLGGIFLLDEILLVTRTHAADNVISNTVTSENGGFNLNGADSLTITDTGEITRAANYSQAIQSTGDGNTIVNQGLISSSGSLSQLIYIDNSNNNAITLSGTLTSSGTSSRGILLSGSDYNTFMHSGSLTTNGYGSPAIYLSNSDNNTFTQSGSTITNGTSSRGVLLSNSNYNSFTHSGSMATSGTNSYGFYQASSNYNSFIHSGSLSTSGTNAHGIYQISSDNNTFTHSGSLTTSGSGAHGIYLDSSDNNIFNITGQVTSSQANAIEFDDDSTDNILNLTAGAVLSGAIDLGTGGNFVNISTTPGHSAVWDFGSSSNIKNGIQVSGTGSYLVDGNVFYAIDTTAQLSQTDTLGDSAGMLSNIAASRFGASPSSTFEQPSGFAYMRDDGSVDHSDARFWGEFIGSTSSYGATGTSLGYNSIQYGLALGYERDFDDTTLFGVMGGYLGSKMKADSQFDTSQKINSEGGFLGLYSARDFSDQFKLSGSLNAGLINNKSSRSFNNNAVVPAATETATASYNSTFIAPSISISKDYVLDEYATLTPSLSALYAHQWSDSYTETGSSANLTVGKGQSSMFEVKGELGITGQIEPDEKHIGGSITARFGAMMRVTPSNNAPTLSLAGIGTLTNTNNVKDDLVAATVGLDFNFKIKDNIYLTASSDFALGNNDYFSAQGKLGFKIRF